MYFRVLNKYLFTSYYSFFVRYMTMLHCHQWVAWGDSTLVKNVSFQSCFPFNQYFFLLVWLRHHNHSIVLLKFNLFLPVFWLSPTAPRAFELLTRFKRSQFGTDLRQCFIYLSFLFVFLLLFLFHLICHWLEWGDADWRKLTIQADVLAEIHIYRCLNANVSHTTLTYRHITKHI